MSHLLERTILERACELIAPRENWTQREYAVDRNGYVVDWRSTQAARFCAAGAIYRAAYELADGNDSCEQFTDEIVRKLNRTRRLTMVNDSDGRSVVLKHLHTRIAELGALEEVLPQDGQGQNVEYQHCAIASAGRN